MLVAERISKNFGNVVCLRQISFAVAPGEFVAVIGANGSGKTTLLDILSGFVHADGGTISILGMRAESRSPQWRARRGVLRTFQEPLVNEQLSVSECLKLAASGARPPGIIASLYRGQSYRRKDRESSERADAVLGRIGWPQTVWHKEAGKLSYGERKLLAVGQMHLADGRVALCDEPTAGLDYEQADRAFGLLKDWQRKRDGRIVIITTHEIDQAQEFADRVLELADGTIRSKD